MFKQSFETTINTDVEGFYRREDPNPSMRKYAVQNLTRKTVPDDITKISRREREFKFTFSNEHVIGVLSYNNDIMVVTAQYNKWNVKGVLDDPQRK